MTVHDRTHLPPLERNTRKSAKETPSYADVGLDLYTLEERHPDRCKVFNIGKTEEGRDILALKLSNPVAAEKAGVMVTGSETEQAMQLVHDLLDGKAQSDLTRLADESEVWLIPVVNPDGYEFSRNHDSWWQKNRASKDSDSAQGMDLNRLYRGDCEAETAAPPANPLLDFMMSHQNVHEWLQLPDRSAKEEILPPWSQA